MLELLSPQPYKHFGDENQSNSSILSSNGVLHWEAEMSIAVRRRNIRLTSKACSHARVKAKCYYTQAGVSQVLDDTISQDKSPVDTYKRDQFLVHKHHSIPLFCSKPISNPKFQNLAEREREPRALIVFFRKFYLTLRFSLLITYRPNPTYPLRSQFDTMARLSNHETQ